MPQGVRKSRSGGPLRSPQSPEDVRTAELVDFLLDLDHNDDAEDMTPRTPSLSGSVSSCEDEDWESAGHVRRISTQLFSGHIVSWSKGEGIIKGRTGTRYTFTSADLPAKERHHATRGLPVLFEPQLRHSRPMACKISIEWRNVLLRSLNWTWFGPPIPVDALTVDGICVSWDTMEVNGVIAINAGGLRATISVSGIALDDVDRSTLCAGFPVSLDFIRDKRAPKRSQLHPSTLRIQWRGVIERYATHLRTPCPDHLASLLDPSLLASTLSDKTPRMSTGRARPLRPLPATVMRLTGRTGMLKTVHDGSLVPFTLTEDTAATLDTVKPGHRIFYWRGLHAEVSAIALLGRAPLRPDRWPTLTICAASG